MNPIQMNDREHYILDADKIECAFCEAETSYVATGLFSPSVSVVDHQIEIDTGRSQNTLHYDLDLALRDSDHKRLFRAMKGERE